MVLHTRLDHSVSSHAPTGVVLADDRFEKLMGANAWARLVPAVRQRFARNFCGAASLVYKGEITETRSNAMGWWVAQICRVIGAPLPLDLETNAMPAIVTVTEDVVGGGQFWTRCYGRPSGFPQVVHSSKQFSGPTGLQEYVGAGITMMLRVDEDAGGMVFGSAGFRLKLGPVSLRLPGWMTPGQITVRHDDLGDGSFAFTLRVAHRWFGELAYQRAIFREVEPMVHQ